MKYKTSLDIMRGCMGCGKGITRACRLNAHMKKCKKLRALLECPICKKMLQSQDDMEDHIRFDHACTRCGFRNKCPDTVIEHTKMVPNCDHCVHCNKDISAECRVTHHSKCRGIYCKICNKYINTYKDFVKLHGKNVCVFTCMTCEWTTPSKSLLKKHIESDVPCGSLNGRRCKCRCDNNMKYFFPGQLSRHWKRGCEAYINIEKEARKFIGEGKKRPFYTRKSQWKPPNRHLEVAQYFLMRTLVCDQPVEMLQSMGTELWIDHYRKVLAQNGDVVFVEDDVYQHNITSYNAQKSRVFYGDEVFAQLAPGTPPEFVVPPPHSCYNPNEFSNYIFAKSAGDDMRFRTDVQEIEA